MQNCESVFAKLVSFLGGDLQHWGSDNLSLRCSLRAQKKRGLCKGSFRSALEKSPGKGFGFYWPHLRPRNQVNHSTLEREREGHGCPSCFLKHPPLTETCPKGTAWSKYLSAHGPEHPPAHSSAAHSPPMAPSAPGSFCHRVTVSLWAVSQPLALPGTPLLRTLSRAASGPPAKEVLFGVFQELNLYAVFPWWEWKRQNNIEIKKVKK